MSTDYYARLEGARGPQPSEQMIAAIAQGLHLSREERDHLFRLAGHQPPASGGESEYISPGLMRIFDRLTPDTAAEIVTELGETLRQTPLGIALAGDLTRYAGPARSIGYRWFTDPATRSIYPVEDHQFYSRMYASGLRRVLAARGPGSKAARFAELLNAESEQFRALWKEHEVGVMPKERKRFRHPEVGLLELNCQILLDPVESTSLLVYTAVPGSESYEKLQLLAIIGASPSPGG
ncbi:helix-turn-helix transcriptional regulator [Mycobacteroides abscessus]|uniref:helix-turn-helix transcriptional regulator n=1 Tax=Mycobacteroides abscessus TaxID=36809 RepID=UPI002ED27478